MRLRTAVPLVFLCVAASPSSWAADIKPADCVAASETSLSLRDQHKLHAAREQLLLCASSSCPTEIREECLRRIERVNESIPTIVFQVKDRAGNDLSAVNVTIDGQPFAERLDGTALALDPGTHTFRFESEGRPAVEKALVIREAEKVRHEPIVIGVESPSSGSVRTPSLESWSTPKTLSVIAGGVGIVGLALGAIFGGIAASKWSDAKDACFGSRCPNYDRAVADQESASSAALVSTIGFIGGAAAVATGVALWLTAPSTSASTRAVAWTIVPTAGPRASGVLLQRGF